MYIAKIYSLLLVSNPVNFTEFLIALSIIMMMLSFVSERVSNFLKLYFQDKRICIFYPYRNKSGAFKIWLYARIEFLAVRQPSIYTEKIREYRVMTINIIIGVIIAIVVNANFFQIVGQISTISEATSSTNLNIVPGWRLNDFPDLTALKKRSLILGGFYFFVLMWSISLILFNNLVEVEDRIKPASRVRRPFYVLFFIIPLVVLFYSWVCKDQTVARKMVKILGHTSGFIITGLFLSLGSKFWHDLLDLLFKFKNTQQRLNEKSTYTDYDSPEKLMRLANTSHHQVASDLMEKYEEEFWEIDGVVSVGLNAKLDQHSGFFKHVIEVEYTTHEAQTKLLEIKAKGSIIINGNRFLLKDYLSILHTAVLEALVGMDASPVCHAYNKKRATNRGSFALFKDDTGKLMASSNLHVFATPADLKAYAENGKKISNKNICLHIDGKPYDAQLKSYKFGNAIYNSDYATAEVQLNGANPNTLINLYNKTVNISNITSFEKNRMKMFGAVSKALVFKSNKFKTDCKINYGPFEQKLNLYKISALSHSNVSKGDSGSVIYYKDNADNTLKKAMLVAKSDTYAYMFLINYTI